MIRIATRGSALALWQARQVQELLVRQGESSELVVVTTQGDVDRRPFSSLEGSGFFTRSVQEAVLRGEADIAVHSYKDLPSARPAGLVIAAVPERADPRDVLLVSPAAYAADAPGLPLSRGAHVGTSAARRRAQLESLRPDLALADLRGNVPTRVGKLRSGEYDAIVLAKAGLDRLKVDLSGLMCVVLEPHVLMPAPAQGALAVETTEKLAHLIRRLDVSAVRRLVESERALMSLFDAGCQLALGALAADDLAVSIKLTAWFGGRWAAASSDDPFVAAEMVHAQLTAAQAAIELDQPPPTLGGSR